MTLISMLICLNSPIRCSHTNSPISIWRPVRTASWAYIGNGSCVLAQCFWINEKKTNWRKEFTFFCHLIRLFFLLLRFCLSALRKHRMRGRINISDYFVAIHLFECMQIFSLCSFFTSDLSFVAQTHSNHIKSNSLRFHIHSLSLSLARSFVPDGFCIRFYNRSTPSPTIATIRFPHTAKLHIKLMFIKHLKCVHSCVMPFNDVYLPCVFINQLICASLSLVACICASAIADSFAIAFFLRTPFSWSYNDKKWMLASFL